MKIKRIITIFLFSLAIVYYSISTIAAQECGADLDCQIAQIQKEISALSPAQEKNRADLAGLNKQIADIAAKISNFTKQLTKLETEIKKRDASLAFTKDVGAEWIWRYI